MSPVQGYGGSPPMTMDDLPEDRAEIAGGHMHLPGVPCAWCDPVAVSGALRVHGEGFGNGGPTVCPINDLGGFRLGRPKLCEKVDGHPGPHSWEEGEWT